jgi:ABC-2 type transport system ATP-binding protein
MIETQNLTRTFGDHVAVDNLTLTVAAGELFALLGPNGAGKTTTTRLLACLIAPTSGTARVVGRDIRTEQETIRARIGILTETPGLYEKLTATQNLTFFANLYSVENPTAQVEKYLKLLELWDVRDTIVGGFSKGMKQKMAIARALLHEPDLIFLDEPTSGLDPSASKTVRDFLADLKARGRTIFLTTHNLDEAERLADKIGILKHRLLALDTTAHLRQSLFGQGVVIEVHNSDADLAGWAMNVDGVFNATMENDRLRVTVDDPTIVTPRLIAALVLAGVQILSVTPERASLESIYLHLVGEGVP